MSDITPGKKKKKEMKFITFLYQMILFSGEILKILEAIYRSLLLVLRIAHILEFSCSLVTTTDISDLAQLPLCVRTRSTHEQTLVFLSKFAQNWKTFIFK